MATLLLEDFRVRYPEFTLGPLDLGFGPGERVALVGPNGAGKSTTLRAMAGHMREYDGSVRLDDREVRDDPVDVRARVGMLPERLSGLGWMTVRERLGFLARLYPSWDAGYAKQLTDRMSIPMDSKVGTLSRGTGMKLSFVAAEAFRPDILLLDEPTAGVDPVMRYEMLDVIDACAPRGGHRTVIFSSHILEDVERIADRLLIISNGRIVTDRPTSELREGDAATPLSEIIYRQLSEHES